MQLKKASAAFLSGVLTLLVLAGGWSLLQRTRLSQAVPSPSPREPAFEPSAPPDFELPSVRSDADRDGLPDDLEAAYRTDPANPDTDGDGYADGLEVANGYDPTKPSPGDKLAAAPGTPAPLPSLTEQFLVKTGLPAEPESILKSDQLDEFIAEVNARYALPAIPAETLAVTEEQGAAALQRYLDAVSHEKNPKVTRVTIGDLRVAFRALTATGNTQQLNELIAELSANTEELKKAPTPREALALHQKYVAATTALRDNASRLLDFRTDTVGALAAAARIEDLRDVFTEVSGGLQALAKKYGIS